MAVKLKEIAVLAGVSQPVVSAVLNNTGGSVRVSDEKSRKIIELADKLGYVPNYAAQQMRGKQTPTIGIIGGSFQAPMQTVLVSQLMDNFSRLGYFVLLSGSIDEEKRMTHSHIAARELLSRGIDGAVLIGSYSLQTQKLLKLPCVILRNSYPGQSYDFNIDSLTGTFLATRHLLEHGHKKMLIAVNRQAAKVDSVLGNDLKYAGVKKAFREAGLPEEYLKTLIITDDFENNQSALLRLIQDEAFTSLICSNDFIAGRIMSFLQSKGLKIPDDLAIVGYNGSAFTKFTSPPLTTVVQPLKLMAEKASELLLHRMEKSISGIDNCKFELISPYLMTGGSCGCNVKPGRDLVNRPETLIIA